MLRGPGGKSRRLRFGFLVVLATGGGREETGRRQLVGVTGHDRPVGPHERPDRVGRG